MKWQFTLRLTARWTSVGFVLVTLLPAMASGEDRPDLFAPAARVLERRCLSCHSDAEKKGGLSLQTEEAFRAGGESGALLDPAAPSESLLLTMISAQEGRAEMPKDADPLSAEELADLHAWVMAGVLWPAGRRLELPAVTDRAWWSLAPLRTPSLPATGAFDGAWVESAVDVFISAGHRQQGVDRVPRAERRTLIRRLSFDLVGLPPQGDEVEAFVGDDRADAYERLVDRFLASPRFGERWARHWLDVVHFGETHGYDKDQPRPNAWPYRDYVIRAFNEDKPYRRFIEEQLAGDILYPDTLDGNTALGFLAAGPWDLIGHAEVPESKIDGQIARHLDRDDMVATTINTFCSMTVHCAQCHHHKFDPMTQEDYYRLQANFAAIDRADRRFDVDPEVARRRREWTAAIDGLKRAKEASEAVTRTLTGPELSRLDKAISDAQTTGNASPAFGYHSAIEPEANTFKWVQIDLGESVEINKVTYVACYDDFAGIGVGFGFPPSYFIAISDDPAFKHGVTTLAQVADRNPASIDTVPQTIDGGRRRARYVRFAAMRLARRQNDFIFALAELRVLDRDGRNIALGKTVSALDSIEAEPRWSVKNLVDDIAPGYGMSREGIEALQAERERLLETKMGSAMRDRRKAVDRELARLKEELKALPAENVVYAGTIHAGQGAFAGTGAKGGVPRVIRVLARGDVTKPGVEVGPGGIEAVIPGAGQFSLSNEHREADRRAALAAWITRPDHPLTWRSIVNRLWHYHFGRGLVATPNDFGRMGEEPTHPELLDTLASELREEILSLKGLHRQIVTSATYRLASGLASEKDADGRWLGGRRARRLEAEAIRDAILSASDRLDGSMGGPSFRDFVVEKPEHSPHYQYHLADPNDPATHRRSIYRFAVRSQQQPWMAALDCADPSMIVDRRNESLSPLQALALLNDGLVLTMAGHFADSLARTTSDVGEQVERGVERALSRPATDGEREMLAAYAREHGLANLCRLLFNANEFVMVD
jgi:mono/diheme cytochrome c family protein